MNITSTIIITVVTYILGAFTKAFVYKIPKRFIPIQNVIIGLFSGFICYFANIENNLLNSLVFCIMATMGAGGFSDLVSGIKKSK